MSEHLPECLHSRPCERAVRGTGDRHVVSGSRCDNCDDPCICDRLRACTVRVLGEAREAVAEIADWYPIDLFPKPTSPDDSSARHGAEMARVTVRNAIAAIDRLAQEAP